MTSLFVETFYRYGDEDGDEAENLIWKTLAFDPAALSSDVLTQSFSYLFPKEDRDRPPIYVSTFLIDDPGVQLLNQQYRGQDKPTNVLSFGYFSTPLTPSGLASMNPVVPLLLGDLVFSYSRIHTQALEQQKIFKNHFTHLLVHGLLHLLGYNHISEDEALVMEGLERDILTQFGVKDPYSAEGEAFKP